MSSSKYILQNISTKCLYGILLVQLRCLISTKKDNVFAFEYPHNQQDLNENPPCEHPIYCIGGPGTILHTVQMENVYNDSKTFVDKPLKHDPTQTIENFRVFMRVNIIFLSKLNYVCALLILFCTHFPRIQMLCNVYFYDLEPP